MPVPKTLRTLLSGKYVRGLEVQHVDDVIGHLQRFAQKLPKGAPMPKKTFGSPDQAQKTDAYFHSLQQGIERLSSLPRTPELLQEARRQQAAVRGGGGALALAVLGVPVGKTIYDAGVEEGRFQAQQEKTAMIKTARIHYSYLLDDYADSAYGAQWLECYEGTPFMAEAEKLHKECQTLDAKNAQREVARAQLRVKETMHEMACTVLEAELLSWRAQQEGTAMSPNNAAEKVAGRLVDRCVAKCTPKEWSDHFEGTPFYKQALALEVKDFELEAEREKLRDNRWELRRAVNAKKDALKARLKAWQLENMDASFKKEASEKTAGSLYLDPVLPRKSKSSETTPACDKNYGPEAWLRDFESEPDLYPIAKAIYDKSQEIKVKEAVERAEEEVWRAKSKMLNAELLKRHMLKKKAAGEKTAAFIIVDGPVLDAFDDELLAMKKTAGKGSLLARLTQVKKKQAALSSVRKVAKTPRSMQQTISLKRPAVKVASKGARLAKPAAK